MAHHPQPHHTRGDSTGLSRRSLLGKAGVIGAAGGAIALGRPAPAHAASETISSGTGEVGLTVLADGQGASFQQSDQAPVGTHAVSCVTHGATDNNSALNVASDNALSSAMMVTGQEAGRGTIKVAHIGRADGSDQNAAALSLSLNTAGTACQGIFLDAPDGTTGTLVNLRNNGTEVLKVQAGGRLRFANPANVAAAEPLPPTPAGFILCQDPAGNPIKIPYYPA